MIEINAPVRPASLKEKTSSVRSKDNGFGDFLGAAGTSGNGLNSATPELTPVSKPVVSAAPHRSPTAKTGALNSSPSDAAGLVTPDSSVDSSSPAPAQASQEPSVAEDDAAAEPAACELEKPKDDPTESWAQQATTALSQLGISVDAAKVAQLPPQGMRELEIALRAAVKDLQEGQSKEEVAQVVTQLLPSELEPTLQKNASEAIPTLALAASAPTAALASATAASASQGTTSDAALPLPPSEPNRQNQEIRRLSETVEQLIKPSEAAMPLTSTATPVAPSASLPQTACADPAAAKPAATSKLRQEDLSAFLRLGAVGAVAAHSDAPVDARAPLSFKPSGTAGEVLAHQVYDEFQFRTGQDQREMILKLWPRELGEVSVHVRIQQGERVEAKILVQNDTIRQALLEHTPVLRECLAKQGLELGSLSVSVGGGGDAPSQERRGRSGRGRSGHDWEDGIVQTSAFVPAGVDTGRRNGYNSIDVLT